MAMSGIASKSLGLEIACENFGLDEDGRKIESVIR